jgi:cell wall-associated NlpC family hydrolase
VINYTYQFRVNKYLRETAVKYALTYALKPNPNYRYLPLINDTSGDCANFLSQCLRAGGAPMSYMSGHAWWYNNQGTPNTKDDTWSISWTVAHSLYWYLKINQANNYNGVKALEVQSPSQLELGDLIFFEDNKGLIFHSAIVTGFSDSLPLVSHHSYEALNIPYRSSWPAIKYHYLKISI